MAEFFNEYGALLWEGTLETLYMTLFATLFAYVLGLPMGVLLTVTKAGGVAPAPRFNAVFGWLVNLLRSLPFIILMFFIIPFTRLLVGTSIGATAALVPLTLSAAPFIARMVEQSLEEIDTGVIEAAQCMGATRWQIVTRVLLVESVPSLLRAVHQPYHHFGLYGHHRQRGRGGPGQPGVPLRLSAVPETRHVCHRAAADPAGVRHPDHF